MLQIEGDGESIKELERNMRIDENIIRYLSLKIDKISDIPSIMVKKTLENSTYIKQEEDKSMDKKLVKDKNWNFGDYSEEKKAKKRKRDYG